jgi:peptidoglycan lytic transglycosylase G
MITEYKRSNFRIAKFVTIFFLILLVWYVVSILIPNSNDDKVLFVVETGESVASISNRLDDQDFISSDFAFKVYLQFSDKAQVIKAGDHYISKSMSMFEIIQELAVASAQADNSVTLIEGWDNNDIAEYLFAEIDIQVNDFLAAANRDYSRYNFLPQRNIDNYLQGYLFPDTYRILPNASAEDVVIKLLDTFEDKVYSPMQKAIAEYGLSLHEILTLASIVEMEVRSDSDRKLVADLFLRRLADNYPLQSDATVNYVTKSGRAQSTISDTKIDSPYNTYKYAGLPPGPIGNPSLSSINAVIYPQSNSFYFFLTTKDDGRVVYSRTYDEHLQYKAKYLD